MLDHHSGNMEPYHSAAATCGEQGTTFVNEWSPKGGTSIERPPLGVGGQYSRESDAAK